ncbi:PAP2 domain-protein [Podospora aff. communis PSN243]|uniref:PAP2 domain-protein n=1 Tax=Podospora aff. communis PSN243 TaxID=3040156 RepID=A0AAV9GLM2_9PEZI|nr:PAP2 domain-protein [Podospora aff. communis PSN243]
MPDESVVPLIPPFSNRASIRPTPSYPTHANMDDPRLAGGGGGRKKGKAWVLALSYAFDWFILVVGGVVGYIMGHVSPNMRPFSLQNPDISFPFTVKETVPVWIAVVASVIAPIIIIAFICLIFVPGATVPPGTPKELIWKRKLWELHMGWLGLGLSVIATWLITNGMKNMFGKPRPDLLDRCQPDLANIALHIAGGIANSTNTEGVLVYASICTNTDKYILDDGFRSYPSGHSSSAAAGLIYLSLFIASKFAITIPFFAPAGYTDAAFAAFPSRTRAGVTKTESYELQNRGASASPVDPALQKQLAYHGQTVLAVRRQAAAPPLYLLFIAVLPFFGAVFIASSRWFDFRHHGFDILFGFLIGTVTAVFAFRYYHLPISQGAGWAWGPRSTDKAFWGGVGSYSYATDRTLGVYRGGDEEEALDAVERADSFPYRRDTATGTGIGTGQTPSVRKSPTVEDEREQEQDTAYRGGSRS